MIPLLQTPSPIIPELRKLKISVGIPTDGKPDVEPLPDGTYLLRNMLIGKDFHWQKRIEAILPEKPEITADGEFPVICRMDPETYLKSVVGSEMNPAAPLEFLKAHAIISRSWAVGKMLRYHPEGRAGMTDTAYTLIGWDDTAAHTQFHVCSDDHCQRFQGLQPISPEAREAIESTAGLVLVDPEGNLVDARFSKCCGGHSELFSTCWQPIMPPGLLVVEDPWCDLSGLPEGRRKEILSAVMKDYDLPAAQSRHWTVSVSREEIRDNLRAKFGRDVGEIRSMRAVERGPSGRISLLEIEGAAGRLFLGKELWIRRLLSPTHLYSSAFDIAEKESGFELHGRGWGHGVGLCQIGAARMAAEGASHGEILSHYYPTARIQPLS